MAADNIHAQAYNNGRPIVGKEYILRDGRKRLAALMSLGRTDIDVRCINDCTWIPPDFTSYMNDGFVSWIKEILADKSLLPKDPGPYQPIPFPEFSDVGYRRLDATELFDGMVSHMTVHGQRILDLGCNLGYNSFRLNELGATCVGMDVLPVHYYVPMKLAEYYGVSSTFIWDYITPQSILATDGHFDTTIFVNTIHHIMVDSIFYPWDLPEWGFNHCVDILRAIRRKSDRLLVDMVIRPSGDPRWDSNDRIPNMGSTYDKQVDWIKANMLGPAGFTVDTVVRRERPLFICR